MSSYSLDRILSRLLTTVRHRFAHRPARVGRRSARRAIVFGFLAFLVITAGLATAAETVKPEWRDPEYGYRLRQARFCQKLRPNRPLVLFVGSSRVQMGISPAAMKFPDEPGSPVPFNFGYRGAFPVAVWLQVMRLLDDGVKPAAIVYVLSTVDTKVDGAAEEQYPEWGSRFSSADLRRLAPYINDPTRYRRELNAARWKPWGTRRELLVSNLLPEWQLPTTRFLHEGWERMDQFGFTPFPEERLTDEIRQTCWNEVRVHHSYAINTRPPGKVSDRALRDMIARCREEGIPLAIAWAPESPAYRAVYTSAGWAGVEAYTRTLTSELGVPVFPAPTHLEETDFADGCHLLPKGAAKYSRWLADTHLRPWLAEVLK